MPSKQIEPIKTSLQLNYTAFSHFDKHWLPSTSIAAYQSSSLGSGQA